MTRAARELRISQPALSAMLKKLEAAGSQSGQTTEPLMLEKVLIQVK